jgi:hypothetical protein
MSEDVGSLAGAMRLERELWRDRRSFRKWLWLWRAAMLANVAAAAWCAASIGKVDGPWGAVADAANLMSIGLNAWCAMRAFVNICEVEFMLTRISDMQRLLPDVIDAIKAIQEHSKCKSN